MTSSNRTIDRRGFFGLAAGGATLLLCPGCRSGAGPGSDSFSFAAINDTHIEDQASGELARRAVKLINRDGRIAFTVALGDLTRASTATEMAWAKQAFAELRGPLYAIPGNHDATPGIFDKEFGPRNRYVRHGRWHLIMIDTGPELEPIISFEHRTWIRKQLELIPVEEPVVLCSHHPFNPNTRMYRVKNADAVLDDFSSRNLRAVISGHYHGNQVETRDGVLFVTTACLASTRSNHDGTLEKGFRLFHCKGDQITTEFVVVHRDEADSGLEAGY
jgi:3',5'-cyclic AMP phosphodiesterase CpdA